MGYCNHYRPIETHIETMLSWELGMPHPQNSHGPFDETIGQQVELLQKADNSSANVGMCDVLLRSQISVCDVYIKGQ